MPANRVIAGDYNKKKVVPKQNSVEISIGIFDALELNSSNVEKFEVITDVHRDCAYSNITRGLVTEELLEPIKKISGDISVKNRNRNIILVKFYDGKNSLLDVDKKIYQLVSKSCIEHKTRGTENDIVAMSKKAEYDKPGMNIFALLLIMILIVIGAAALFSMDTSHQGTIISVDQETVEERITNESVKNTLSEKIDSEKERTNLILAIESIGIDVNEIKNFINISSNPEVTYRFNYNGDSYNVLSRNEVIRYINRNFGGRIGILNLYEQGYEPITYDKLLVGSVDRIALSILSEEFVKLHLTTPTQAGFNSSTDYIDVRCDNVYYVASSVNDIDGFGISTKKDYYIEFKKDEGRFKIIHAEINGQIITSKEDIDLAQIRQKSGGRLTDETIILEYNEVGDYGIIVGKEVIYYIPIGQYEVKTMTPKETLYQLKVHSFDNSEEYNIIVSISLADIEASAIIDIHEESYIAITENSKFMLTPIS
jgi:hypothetical protein